MFVEVGINVVSISINLHSQTINGNLEIKIPLKCNGKPWINCFALISHSLLGLVSSYFHLIVN